GARGGRGRVVAHAARGLPPRLIRFRPGRRPVTYGGVDRVETGWSASAVEAELLGVEQLLGPAERGGAVGADRALLVERLAHRVEVDPAHEGELLVAGERPGCARLGAGLPQLPGALLGLGDDLGVDRLAVDDELLRRADLGRRGVAQVVHELAQL